MANENIIIDNAVSKIHYRLHKSNISDWFVPSIKAIHSDDIFDMNDVSVKTYISGKDSTLFHGHEIEDDIYINQLSQVESYIKDNLEIAYNVDYNVKLDYPNVIITLGEFKDNDPLNEYMKNILNGNILLIQSPDSFESIGSSIENLITSIISSFNELK